MTKATDPMPESPEIIQKIIDGLRNGKFEVHEGTTRIVLKLKALPKHKTGKEPSKSDIMEDVIKTITKHGFALDEETPEKRIYRKRENWPDPEQEKNAEANQLTKKLTPRVSEVHADLFNRLANEFPSKRKALEAAIDLLAAQLEFKQ